MPPRRRSAAHQAETASAPVSSSDDELPQAAASNPVASTSTAVESLQDPTDASSLPSTANANSFDPYAPSSSLDALSTSYDPFPAFGAPDAGGSSTGFPVPSGSGSWANEPLLDAYGQPLPPLPELESPMDPGAEEGRAAMEVEVGGLGGGVEEGAGSMSAKAKGKRKAVAPNERPGSGKGRARSPSAVTEGSPAVFGFGDDDQEQPQGEVKLKPKSKKRVKKLTKKTVPKPALPILFRVDVDQLDEEEKEEREAELARCLNGGPALARKLHAALERQKSIYRGAYQALESELIKVQIEDSVLRNLKTVVKDERDKMRYGRAGGGQ